MIVITIDLHSAITGELTNLGRAVISNDGTGTKAHGNYTVRVGRKGHTVDGLCMHPQRQAKVVNHPRLRESVWTLLRKALQEAGY